MTHNEQTTAVEELEALVASANDYAQAETQARLLLAEVDIENEPELYCRVLLALSTSLWRRGVSQEALTLAEQALSLAQDNHLKHLEARALNLIGTVYGSISDYPKALEYYGKVLALYEELGNKKGIASNLGNCGIVYQYLSDYPKALEYYGKSLALYEELGNKNGIATIFGNCGIVYKLLSDYPKALEYYGKALALYEELGSKEGIARNLGNIGEVSRVLSDYAKALEYYGKSLALYEELGSKDGIARNLGNCGIVYRNLSDYAKALEYYGKALALYEELGSKDGIAINLFNCGNMYGTEEFEGYDAAKAEEYLLKSLAIFEETGAKKELYDNHKGLAELYKKQERWKESDTHFRKFYELEQEVISEESQKQAQKFAYERKIAEQEKQIAIERAETQARLDEQQKLLHNVLPPIIADRLLRNETFIADSYPSVSVLFMDLVGFTRIAAIIPPRHLIYLLNTIFSNADAVMEKHGLEKIKTIGDAYMAVAGAPIHQDDHAQRAALAAIDVMEAMNNLSVIIPEELGETSWTEQVGEIQVRIGLHCGEAIGGVIGDKKFSFDLWGDAVNTAARMESHGEAGKIHCSEEFKNALVETQHAVSLSNNVQFISCGEMEIKGKGKMRTYFLERGFDKL